MMKNQKIRLWALFLGSLAFLLAGGLAGCGGKGTPTTPTGEGSGVADSATPGRASPSEVRPDPGPFAPPGKTAGEPAGEASLLSPAREKEVVVYFDEMPVTAGELERFGKRMVGTPHGMKKTPTDPLSFIPSYQRFFAVVKQARAEKLDQSVYVRDQVRLMRVAPLGPPYLAYLIANAEIPSREFEKGLPKQWTKINFRLFVFETREDAQAARPTLRGPVFAPPENTKGFVYVAGKAAPETGPVFPGSGFFDVFDEPDLFALKEGELSGVVQSGLGPALAVPLSRWDLNPKEQEAFIAELRQNLGEQYGRARADKEVSRVATVLMPDHLTAVLGEKVSNPAFASTTPLARVDDINITMPVFVQVGRFNLSFILGQFPRNQWVTQIGSELKAFVDQAALGIAAEKAGFDKTARAANPSDVREALDEVLYTSWERKFWRGTRIKVTEEEARAAYEADKRPFTVGDSADIQYYFTPMKEDLEGMSKRAEKGIPFAKLSVGLARQKGKAGHFDQTLPLKERNIVKGSNDLKILQDGIFAMADGETRILETEMGYYLMHLVKRQKARVVPFDEVRDFVVSSIEVRKRDDALSAEINRLVKEVKVRMAGEPAQPQKGIPGKGIPDQG